MLEVKDISAGYGGKAIIRNISFSLKEGDTLALLGPNGSGKSTLIKVISGVLEPLSGEVFLNNINLLSLKPLDRAKIVAVLPQSLTFDFPFSVEEAVAMGCYPFGGRMEEKIEWALERLDLKKLRARKVTSLSGGEFRRVIIAKVLVQASKLLLLDEPMSYLDLKHQLIVLDTLKELSKNGLIIVCVIHDINMALHAASSVMLMKEGTPLAIGSPNEVLIPDLLEETFQVKLLRCSKCGGFLFPNQPQNYHCSNACNYKHNV